MRATLVAAGLAAALTALSAWSGSAARAGAPGATGADDGVRQACLDYTDSIYKVKPELLDRSTSADLVKLGMVWSDEAMAYTASPMTFATLRGIASSYNKDGAIPEDAPREVTVLGEMDQVAVAKLTAAWGIDYLQLAKVDGRWQIQHILWQTPPKEPSATDEEQVRRACLDYAESAYLMKPEYIEKSVHPEVVKVGYIRRGDAEEYGVHPMNHQQLKDLVAKWNESGRFGPDSRKDVEVLDLSDATACAKLSAEWGVDYFNLAKFDGRWQIIQVIWQTYPPEAKTGR